MKSIIHELKARQDFEYRSFCIRLLPTVSADTILGVRFPQIRSYARQIAGSAITREFIQVLPHTYLEENYLHGFLIEQETEFACALAQMERFLPYIDNWAVCDSVYPRALEKNRTILAQTALRWMQSQHLFTVRYGIGVLLRAFLDEHFSTHFSDAVALLRSDAYYVNMMCAWYFATALAKQYDQILPYFTAPVLSSWVHNKAIQKAIESRRLSVQQKEELRQLKRKKLPIS